MPRLIVHSRPARVAVAFACAGLLVAGVARAGSQQAGLSAGSGSGTYTATGATYYFDLINTGTASWQYFYVVGPAGTAFLGGAGASSAEQNASCVVGQPDGRANEIECGPMSINVVPPQGHILVIARLSTPAACDAPFQLAAGSTGGLPFTQAGEIDETGSCNATAPTALTRPTLHGTPVVGHTITATPPTWSATPTRVGYTWQRCTTKTCTPIAGATRLTLALTRLDAGRRVRLSAAATIDGTTVASSSKLVAIRARR